ncbi:hypothetical protein PYW08_000439 [Mythimna loreyi]|uniref:Uncharacterized protein n=1 Tax=Mythimna loreyi TaxID=667449 RepID=A0ACC2RCG0_9NEOP|nr:hypothetical protein PYW08_000439 [Mythimna loreyi]
MICVISQFQEYSDGRGTAAFENVDRNTVQYTATAQQTTTTSSAVSGRRRSAGRPMPSRCDPEEFSEAPTKIIRRREGSAIPVGRTILTRAQVTGPRYGRGIPAIRISTSQERDSESQVHEPASVLSRPSRSAIKKHVQFPDEQSCIEEAVEAPSQAGPAEKPDDDVRLHDYQI